MERLRAAADSTRRMVRGELHAEYTSGHQHCVLVPPPSRRVPPSLACPRLIVSSPLPDTPSVSPLSSMLRDSIVPGVVRWSSSPPLHCPLPFLSHRDNPGMWTER